MDFKYHCSIRGYGIFIILKTRFICRTDFYQMTSAFLHYFRYPAVFFCSFFESIIVHVWFMKIHFHIPVVVPITDTDFSVFRIVFVFFGQIIKIFKCLMHYRNRISVSYAYDGFCREFFIHINRICFASCNNVIYGFSFRSEFFVCRFAY